MKVALFPKINNCRAYYCSIGKSTSQSTVSLMNVHAKLFEKQFSKEPIVLTFLVNFSDYSKKTMSKLHAFPFFRSFVYMHLFPHNFFRNCQRTWQNFNFNQMLKNLNMPEAGVDVAADADVSF